MSRKKRQVNIYKARYKIFVNIDELSELTNLSFASIKKLVDEGIIKQIKVSNEPLFDLRHCEKSLKSYFGFYDDEDIDIINYKQQLLGN